MHTNKSLVAILALTASSFMAMPAQAKETPKNDPKTVAAITLLENDAVKADLAGDASFYEKNFAENWTGGDSKGTWYTKAMLVNMIRDTDKNKMNSEEISDLNVRTYGDTAIATYTAKYDMLMNGQNRAATVLTTDTFAKQNGKWMQVSGHSSVMSTSPSAIANPTMDMSKPLTTVKK